MTALAIGLAVAGCSDPTTGDARPGTTGAATGTTSTGSPTKSSDSTGKSLATVKSCDLLNAAASLGLTEVKEESAKSCTAEYPGSVTVGVDVRPTQGVKDFNLSSTAEASDTTVGSHKAKLVKKPTTPQSCAVTIGVTDTSRIDVFATSNNSLDKSCEAAQAVAKAVEPKLP